MENDDTDGNSSPKSTQSLTSCNVGNDPSWNAPQVLPETWDASTTNSDESFDQEQLFQIAHRAIPEISDAETEQTDAAPPLGNPMGLRSDWDDTGYGYYFVREGDDPPAGGA